MSGPSFRRRSDSPVANANSIHLDLLAAGLIPDPFVGENEAHLQWIHSKTWVYTTSFETPPPPASDNERIDLVFQGLDTFATVTLNGREILRYENNQHFTMQGADI